MLIKNSQLTKNQLLDIKRLVQLCQVFDHCQLPIYDHILQAPRDYPCNVLYYEASQLIGFLSIYFFYEEGVEVVVMVTPDKRKQGIGHKMLASMLPFLKEHQIKRLIFPTAYGLNTFWMKEKNLSYISSLFQMQRASCMPAAVQTKLTMSSPLKIQKARIQDIEFLCKVDKACFKNIGFQMKERFQALLEDQNYCIYIALLNNRPVGKAHIYWSGEGVQLLDIAVLPTDQKKGLGHALIAFCVNTLLSQGYHKIALDVELSNKNAIKLYSNLDFRVFNAYHYWGFKLA